MAVVTRKVSDLTGTEAPEQDFASVTVRNHPNVPEPKRLDALPAQLEGLKSAGDLVTLEVRYANGTNKEIHVKHADFAKLLSDENVAKLPGTKGRIPGTRMNGS